MSMLEMSIASQPSAHDEAMRLDTIEWCDETPLGLYVVAGDEVWVCVQGCSADAALSIIAGFRPTWSGSSGRQEVALSEGGQTVHFTVSGPVFIRHIGHGPNIAVRVTGGKPLALWQSGQGWLTRDDAGHSPWVQYVSRRTLISLPRANDGTHEIADPAATFEMIHTLLDWCDELSGLTDSEGLHQPCQNRIHFLTDIWASEADRELFYMYAFTGFIAMLPDNIHELIDPNILQREWAIWHELGHMYQQDSWAWPAHVEVNVNLWSLFAQERFGQPSRLDQEPEHRETAERLLEKGMMDLSREADPFVQLVMLDRLKSDFGWSLFVKLNRKYREAHAFATSDARKISQFCRNVQDICGKDMGQFFEACGLSQS